MVIGCLLGRITVIVSNAVRLLMFILLLFLFTYEYIECEAELVGHDIFWQSLTEKMNQAKDQNTSVVTGKQDWLFFIPELRHLLVGQFWGDAAKGVSQASNSEYADPLPAILDFKAQLDTVGIDLIVVPIPAKATIYPEMISEYTNTIRTDKHHIKFYDILHKHGVNVLDLTDLFLKHRYTDSGLLYCKHDTHWSSFACVITAKEIVKRIGKPSWMDAIPKRKGAIEKRTIGITGDLWKELGHKQMPKEQLQLSYVKEDAKSTANTQPFGTSWRGSPIVLLGDSHNLVFHVGGDMHAQSSGLPDHLAHHLGFSADVVAVRGSGATPSRLNLFRRHDNLKGKRVVIWCLSVREFTQGQGWRKVPVIK